jgi:predicted ATPase
VLIEKPQWRADYIKSYLNSFTVYHFHDTSATSPMRGLCQIGDNEYLRENGSNLAAYLYSLSQTDRKAFDLIEATVRSVAPYFKHFDLKPDRNLAGQISLEWREKDSDMYLNGYSFSDGTIRFIALATLLLQSNPPQVIIIDEPELGLHPAAINKLAAMVKRASLTSQVILSTQSANLVNCFEPEDIIVVDREDGQTVFRRLDSKELSVWLDDYDYSLSDVWEKNLIGGQL